MRTPVARLHSAATLGVVLALVAAVLAVAGSAEAARRPAPKGLKVEAHQGSLSVRWHAVRHAPGYKVRWSVRHSMRGSHRLAATRHRAEITGLAPDTRYYVQVAVAKRKGRGHRISPWSRIVSRRTPPPPCPTVGNLGDPAPAAPTNQPTDLRVASFNIRTINLDSATHPEQRWLNRADRVAALLLGTPTTANPQGSPAPDVIALQEANQSYGEYAARCTNQMIDLRNRLNADGTHHYEGTSLSPSASVGTRILLDTNRVRLESSGAVLLAPASATHPHLAWAILQARNGGQRFFFGSVHLVPSEAADSNTVRDAEWDQLLAVLPGLAQGLPIVLGGDFNSLRYSSNANTTARTHLPLMAAAGVPDMLLGPHDPTDESFDVAAARPLSALNANCMSHNAFEPALSCVDPALVGRQIDYLFASTKLTVKKWEMVLDVALPYPPYTWLGTIPSDHNLIRATVTLPPVTG
jgi:endonuclease/exonuclease/phosphatase family metal-dependent hydrolase